MTAVLRLVSALEDKNDLALARMLERALRYAHEYQTSQLEKNDQLRRDNSMLAAARLNAAYEMIAASSGIPEDAVMKVVMQHAKLKGSAS
jgi:hypothetical protein